ncbi:MAG: division plane positioning ATPase MipZ [Lamprobacter sp.]|uniref:division plane positioning ATPase MipZ n=1 Tax=Lamprobacter sp. TaxID=3100796 RepID=UPI002B25933F|nr:division plane positioning ATPase MipZ [Lamprobacter sp.]MEA3640250.1 division plane positioning ATPase MipZ [Lamprobacter sp.]
MILLLGGEKGGTGKSTVAVNLAVWLAKEGADVVLVDTDLQRTASHFIDRRNQIADLPKVHCSEKHGSVFDTVRDLAKRYEQVIVDAGGRDSEELRTAMVAAQMIYCPLKASQPDIETSMHMNELVKLARGLNPSLEAKLLISMGPTNPVIHEAAEAREILVDLPEFELSPVTIGDRKVYRDSMIEGRGVVEMNNDKAKAEIEALAAEIYGGNR